jgi:hypothetical protein
MEHGTHRSNQDSTMKIDSTILHHISMPLVAPFETSSGRELMRECILNTMPRKN